MTTTASPAILDQLLTTQMAVARVYTASARRARRSGLMRRARQIGFTLNAARDELRTGSPEAPDVALAFAKAAEPKLRLIEVELWAVPADRPHLDQVLDQLESLGVSVESWQRHSLAGYFA